MEKLGYSQLPESCLFCLSRSGICHALYGYHKVMKEAAKILRDVNGHIQKYEHSYLPQRLL